MSVTKVSFAFIYTAFCIALCIGASYASAQSTTTATTTNETVTTTSATTTQQIVDDSHISTSIPVLPPLSDESRMRVVSLSKNMNGKIDTAIARFDNIFARMETRTAKMETLGYDMTDARFYLGEASLALESAKRASIDIGPKIAAYTSAEDYFVAWFDIRDTIAESKAQLTRIKQLLQQAVDDMKIAEQVGIPAVPSSTEETASSSGTSTATSSPVL